MGNEGKVKLGMALHCRVPIIGERTLSSDEVGVEVLRLREFKAESSKDEAQKLSFRW